MVGLLERKRCLITGAGSGIGRAVAVRFLSEGARVVVLDISQEKLAALGREFSEVMVTVHGDVRSFADNQRAIGAAVDAFGGLDVFVGNAGVFDAFRSLSNLSEEEISAGFDEIFGVNVKGYCLGARAALPELEKTAGNIVFTVSTAAFGTGGGGPLYTASKHAIVGLVRQLAYELAPSHIRVNGVAPGGTPTELRTAPSLVPPNAGPGAAQMDAAQLAERLRRHSPIGIPGEAEDHAATYVFLASDQAKAISGVIITSDGGLHVRHPDRIPL